MQATLAIALASLDQHSQRLAHIASSLAHATTPGYKRGVPASPPLVPAFAATVDAFDAAQAAGGAALQVRLDTRAGTLASTGQRLDLALEGEGFFEIATATGPAYTRQGDFHTDARGRLVTAQGDAVMGLGGEIVLSTRTPVIDAQGRVSEPDAQTPTAEPVGQLKIVHIDDPRSLERAGNGLLQSRGTVALEPQPRLRQGALEKSNVDVLHEMTELMSTLRHFESVQKAVQSYDEAMGTAVRKLGELS
ncbi:flagellar hook-basal body complex protein [Xylophilus rhododendri]|uniref:Flagellar hook-basal body complex protein n=1 Tax=Xylophilus rhododendri TaxID=2697032 RepID=A0A857J7F3_9BURK|nr:flagellar hook-basal body protein [Xylophilus rhododendri]QHI99173.1 flagellar hook-basal body complex protein [Xylophilus rhododendri]